MLRSIGLAAFGAVGVTGTGLKDCAPRLPKLPPRPARASASDTTSTTAAARAQSATRGRRRKKASGSSGGAESVGQPYCCSLTDFKGRRVTSIALRAGPKKGKRKVNCEQNYRPRSRFRVCEYEWSKRRPQGLQPSIVFAVLARHGQRQRTFAPLVGIAFGARPLHQALERERTGHGGIATAGILRSGCAGGHLLARDSVRVAGSRPLCRLIRST